jgi:hypothetical protein
MPFRWRRLSVPKNAAAKSFGINSESRTSMDPLYPKTIETLRKEYKRSSELGVSSSYNLRGHRFPDASLRRVLSAKQANDFVAREEGLSPAA